MPPEFRRRIEAATPALYAAAREQYGLELNRGPLGANSRPALVGAKYAEEQGVGPAYHDAVFRAYWQRAADIGDRELLADIAAGVGLERAAFLAALAQPQYNAAVDADIAEAHAYNLSGVPAMILAQRYLVVGAQPYPVLKQAVEQVLAALGGGA